MAGFAAQRVKGEGLSDRVSVRQADMQDLGAWQARCRPHPYPMRLRSSSPSPRLAVLTQ